MKIYRPKVSVCMAAFQGEKFICAQLQSILRQLSADDEVIVVDDCSSDGTRDVVRSLRDPRILLVEHARNRGVTKTFEEALGRATGDIIFLSDQDDVWADDKVRAVLDIFQTDSEVMVVASDAALIDQCGKLLGRSYYETRGRFRSGLFSNLIRCKFLGCTMAFRSELLEKVLPFPGKFKVMHDLWIGSVNALRRGRTFYLDQNLVFYRRHSGAVTAGKLNSTRRLKNRLNMVSAVASYWVGNLLRAQR
jgi:glycosyltransferase involved in cell wall biosynthesis